MASIDKKFIVKLQGKDFVTYEGLLDLAHQKGLVSIKTEMIQVSDGINDTVIVKAIASTKDKEFHGIGDASPRSVNKMIAPHMIRMAETRAKARALRDLTNVGMTAVEEMMDVVDGPKQSNEQGNEFNDKELICSDCNKGITSGEKTYSTKNLGKALCFNCQKKHKK